MEKPKKKKCPVCRSQKTESSSERFKCNKCGYVWKRNVSDMQKNEGFLHINKPNVQNVNSGL